ncbi:DUF4238 domain-containing protein [Chryseobacterium sp. AG844]|uniref:DUF4238 domain-containing protein n=1 Tax=Chryseobacterium sp. AG844 TaxID=2183998 RepID=UPI000D712C7C|nr:DUF4238 domain-containing protein [Chryseobacterium sp. AG844]PWW30921.1 uncharacterized protein DUF4238 [Chryseobacterium sp. AG844]
MVKKKKHHYIPRFYLKRFSINNGGKFLGLYNLNNKKFIPNAALKNQAYGNFLYGEDDEIENALAHIEGNVAKMFYYWTEEKVLIPPPIESNGFKLIKRFMLYQAFRTPNSGENIMESLNKGLKAFVKEFKPELWESLKDATLQHENPVLLGLLHSIEHEKLLDYLDFRFIVNLSLLPFITSDSPIIFYNQLMEQAGNYIGATGLVAKGLQIFYPIHPRLMICLYDPEVYDLGDDVNCCSTECIATIHQLNGLQFINCESQIYFNNFISEEYTHELSNNFQEYRGTKRNINEIINQNNKKFFFISSEDIQIGLQLDFLNIKVNLNDFKNGINPLRHPSFSIR